MRKLFYFVIALAVLAGALWMFGPRVPVDTTVTFDPNSIGDDVDAYLAAENAATPNLREGLGKEVIWAYPASKARTPLAIVYVHGFSASKGEIRPLPDMVSASLGANLFFTRLAGHAQDSAAMGTATVNDWINDYAEAIAIGRRIGDRVIVIATSTGGGLATWGLAQPALTADVIGAVLVSPNYGVQASGSSILTMPFGRTLAHLIVGDERSFEPLNEQHARLWTTSYPTDALLTMAAMTKLAGKTLAQRIKVPALFIYSEQDQVVRPELTKAMVARWGAPAKTILVTDSGDPSNHVIIGDALSPSTTERLAAETTAWIAALN